MRLDGQILRLLSVAALLVSCRTQSDSNATSGVLFPQAPLPTEIAFMDSSTLQDLGPKKTFCANRQPGECFSLVIMIPPNNVIDDVGVATLNLMRLPSSEGLRNKFIKNCRDGLDDYVRIMKTEGLKNSIPIGGIRKTYFAAVKEWRCYIQFSKSEADPLPKIDQNQKALAVKLLKFGLESYSSKVKISTASFDYSGAKLTGSLSDVRIYSVAAPWVDALPAGKKVEAKWRLVPQKGFIGNSGAILNVPIEWGYDKSKRFKVGFKEGLEVVQASIEKAKASVAADASSSTAVGTFLEQATTVISGTAGTNAPMNILSLGVQALKGICKDGSCEKTTDVTVKISGIHEAFSNINSISADDFIMLENGLKLLPDRILDGVIVDKADGHSLEGLLLGK